MQKALVYADLEQGSRETVTRTENHTARNRGLPSSSVVAAVPHMALSSEDADRCGLALGARHLRWLRLGTGTTTYAALSGSGCSTLAEAAR